MKVHIEGDIYLQGDNLGYSIVKRVIAKTGTNAGNETYQAIGHYGSVRSAVELGLLKMKIVESTAETLRELIQEVREYRRFVAEKIDF